MTNDTKDLLNLAAKACGRVVLNSDDMLSDKRAVFTSEGWWAPHLDDGDGARMEAKLDIDVLWCEFGVESGQEKLYESYADHNNDRQAARRWASLRAAAQIGKGMTP